MRLFTTVAVACLLAFAPAAWAADQDFTVVNKTGYQIDDLWVSPASSSNWGRELMGRGTVLEDGDSYDVAFAHNTKACKFDMKVKYHDEDEATWQNLDLCEISKVSLFYDRKAGTTRARTE